MTDLLRCALPSAPDPELAAAIARPRLLYAAVDMLTAARARPTHATLILSRLFRENRKLGSKERPVVAEAVYGVIRHERLIARAGAEDEANRVATWGRIVGGDRLSELSSQGEVSDYADALSLPETVAAEWLARLGVEEAAALGAALAERAPLTIRVNRARIRREQLAARLAASGVRSEPCAGAPDGLRLLDRANAQSLPGYPDGLFEVQDEASQRLVEAAVAQLERMGVTQKALDLCAGSGGKALALAARGVKVRAFDLRSHALDELRERAQRARLTDLISVGDPRPAPLVLVDAPCSGIGRLRRDPALRWNLRPEAHLEAQAAVLAQGAALVQPGGVLLYATCSLLAAENAHAPAAQGDEERWQKLASVELWPHREGTDGFCWTAWQRG